VAERGHEDKDDLDQIFPCIYYWSNLKNDVFNIILPMAIKKYNQSTQRAKGPKGSLSDRLHKGMLNGRQVSKFCSPLLFFDYPLPILQHSIRVLDCN
jgi:hypothetical protein